ncbi:hypothetical protein B0H17DRAFT_1220354 [Mycena rosella]|uniref:Uncharacterized protein n=1 Tax=Mycena rosella TaxID=1033263 RepID=A0AAD7FCJ1_MYCRO|nr:hypothetical protein B0H17DRAFT_1220354 [Mycena rosella]
MRAAIKSESAPAAARTAEVWPCLFHSLIATPPTAADVPNWPLFSRCSVSRAAMVDLPDEAITLERRPPVTDEQSSPSNPPRSPHPPPGTSLPDLEEPRMLKGRPLAPDEESATIDPPRCQFPPPGTSLRDLCPPTSPDFDPDVFYPSGIRRRIYRRFSPLAPYAPFVY